MGHIKRQHLKEAKCVVPNTQVLFAADGIFSALFDKGVFVKLEARTLTALRDALLPKLLSGELRLKDADEFVESLP